MAASLGIEPRTARLTGGCSTTELQGNKPLTAASRAEPLPVGPTLRLSTRAGFEPAFTYLPRFSASERESNPRCSVSSAGRSWAFYRLSGFAVLRGPQLWNTSPTTSPALLTAWALRTRSIP